ncbi:MAG: hypothetical protein JWO82_2222 [Akkermansiaceae bacterium]|nr:hypothetical protein [Akkermansiaceae bacterium]
MNYYNRLTNRLVLTAAAALLAASPVSLLAADETKPSEETHPPQLTPEQMKQADTDFLREACSGGMLHVMASKYALSQVKSPQVRKLAEMLIEHHEKGLKTLADVAAKSGIELPKELLPPQRTMLDEAMTVKGEQFVAVYLINMTTLHVHDILAFSNAAAKSKNKDISGFASDTLPMLKKHLAEIKPMAAAEVELKEDI